MSIMDAKLVFSACQTICQTDAFTQFISTNIVDLGAEDLEIGAGTPLYLNIRFATEWYTTAFGATGYVDFQLDHDTGSTFVDTSPAVFKKRVNISDLITMGTGNGWIVRQAIPGVTKRYLRLMYTRGLNADSSFTSPCCINAWIAGAAPETNVGT